MPHTAAIIDIDISIVVFMSKPMCPLNCSFVYFNPAEPTARHGVPNPAAEIEKIC